MTIIIVWYAFGFCILWHLTYSLYGLMTVEGWLISFMGGILGPFTLLYWFGFGGPRYLWWQIKSLVADD